jgi:hypothetical protein
MSPSLSTNSSKSLQYALQHSSYLHNCKCTITAMRYEHFPYQMLFWWCLDPKCRTLISSNQFYTNTVGCISRIPETCIRTFFFHAVCIQSITALPPSTCMCPHMCVCKRAHHTHTHRGINILVETTQHQMTNSNALNQMQPTAEPHNL